MGSEDADGSTHRLVRSLSANGEPVQFEMGKVARLSQHAGVAVQARVTAAEPGRGSRHGAREDVKKATSRAARPAAVRLGHVLAWLLVLVFSSNQEAVRALISGAATAVTGHKVTAGSRTCCRGSPSARYS